MSFMWFRSLPPAVLAICMLNCRPAAQPFEEPASIQRIDAPREDSPYEAAEYQLARRSPDGNPIEYALYERALVHARRMPLFSSRLRRFVQRAKTGARDISIGAWEELGPGNIGGRTRAFIVHPHTDQILFTAGVSGGLWKSTDGGDSWRALNDLLPNLAVVTLAMDPKDPDILYAGTGEWFTGGGLRGFGIFKTTDGGESWSHLAATSTSSFQYVNKIEVSPNDSSRVYAATFGGVWRSLDAGVTWTRHLDRTTPNLGCQDLVFRTDQAKDYLFATCQGPSNSTTGGSIFRNVDAGDGGQWENVFSPQFMGRTSLAVAGSRQSTIYAIAASLESGDIRNGVLAVYRSTNDGDRDSWEVRSTNRDANEINQVLLSNPSSFFANVCSNGRRSYSNQGSYDQAIAVDPTDPETVWVGGIDSFRSDDGGRNFGMASYWNAARTFRTFVHADQHSIVFHPKYNGTSNQTMFIVNDGGIFRTDQARAPVATGARAACSTANSGITWRSLNNGYAVTQFYAGTVYPGGHAYFGGTQDNGTPRGLDASGAGAWVSLIGGDGGYAAVDPTNPNRVYAETQRQATLNWFRRSNNGGLNFATAMTGITDPSEASRFLFIAPFVMDPSEPRRLYLGGKFLWRTQNGADSWGKASVEVPDGIISAIAVHPSDSGRVLFATTSGFIHRSSSALTAEATTAWPSTRPRTGTVAWLAFDPSNPDIAYAAYSTFNSTGNAGHVFRSGDAGASWERIDGTGDTGIPDIPVNTIVVHPNQPATLYAGSDLGVFVSFDGGATWAREDTGFPTTRVETLAIADNNGPVLYAFTFGRGVFRVRLTEEPSCEYSIAEVRPVPAFGGEARFMVESGDNCAWSVVPMSAIALPVQALGKGKGEVRLNVTMNTSTAPRSAQVMIGPRTVNIEQQRPEFPAVANNFLSAVRINTLPYVGVQDSRRASAPAGGPVHRCTASADSRPQWMIVRAPFSGTMSVSATGTRYDNGQNYGVVLAAYPRTEMGLGDEMGCAVANAPAPGTARLNLNVMEGSEYYIQVTARGPDNVGGYTVIVLNRAP
jgi:photosystem II stability/assembly factor-like uncharacterized protein